MNFLDLPQEILLHILSHLFPRQLCIFSSTSKYIHTLCMDSHLWKFLLYHIYKIHPGSDCTYYDEFKNAHLKYKLSPQQIDILNKINIHFPHLLPYLISTDTYTLSLNTLPLEHIIICIQECDLSLHGTHLQVQPYSCFYKVAIHNNNRYIVTFGVLNDSLGIRCLVADDKLHDTNRKFYTHISDHTRDNLLKHQMAHDTPDKTIIYLHKPQLNSLSYLIDRLN